MRNILFIMSHLGSGSSHLFESLSQHPTIDGFRMDQTYDHPDKLTVLTNNIHKRDNSAAIYMDELLYNHSITCKMLCSMCKFVYLIREPKGALTDLLKNHKQYSMHTAARYYCYRLRGIYEYSRRTPNCVILTWDDLLMNNTKNLQSFLNIKESVSMGPLTTPTDCDIPSECYDCYERYLGHIMRA